MKRLLLAILGIVAAYRLSEAQPINTGTGLTKVIHSNAMFGDGTNKLSLDLTHSCLTGEVLVWSGAAWGCSSASGDIGTGTPNTLAMWTGVNTLGDSPLLYNGSTLLTTTKGITADSGLRVFDVAGAGLSSSANTVSMPNTGPGVSTVTYATITTDVQGRVTASSSGAAPALASTTITAGNGLTGGGDLSANRTIDVGAGLGILSNANDVAIDPTYTQRRVTGTCSDPFGIITVAQDGTVTCSTTTVGSSSLTTSKLPRATAARTLGDSTFGDDLTYASWGEEAWFGKAGAVSYASLTNVGVLTYDTTSHNLVLASQYTSGTPHVLIAASNSGAAATVVDISTGSVAVTGLETVSSTLGVTGATTLSSTLRVTGTTGLTGNTWIGAISAAADPFNVDGRESATSGIVARFSSAVSGSRTFLQLSDGFTYNYGIGTEGATGDLLFSSSVFAGAAGTERMRIAQGGAVTIPGNTYIGGTAANAHTLELYGASQTTTALTDAGNSLGEVYVADSGSVVAGIGGAVTFGAHINSGSYKRQAAIKLSLQDGSSNGSGNLAFSVRVATADTALTEAMKITATPQLDMDSHKIINCANGSSSTDVACFGQIQTGVAADFTGTSLYLPKRTGTTTYGDSGIADDGTTFLLSHNATFTTLYDLTNSVSGFALATSSGNLFFDSKVNTADSLTFRIGVGNQGAQTTTWLKVDGNASDTITAFTAFTTDTTTVLNNSGGTTTIKGDATSNKLTVNGKASDYSLTVNNAQTAATAALFGIVESSTGTYNTTGGAITTTGGSFSVTSTRSSGANNLANRAGYFNASGAQVNQALYTDNGDVTLAATSGATTIGTTGATVSINGSQINFHGSAADSYFYYAGGDTYIRGNGASTHVYVGDNGTSGTVEIAAQGATTNDYGQFAQTYTSTAVAGDAKGVSASNSGTFNTTSAGRNAYGLYVANSSAISSGANTLTSIGAYIDDTTSGANTTVYSLYTDHGDVRLNATNGITGIKGPLTVDNTNSSATDISAQFNYTRTARAADVQAVNVSQSGTVDVTAANRNSYGIKISNTTSKSAGNNSFAVYGVYSDTSGAGATNQIGNFGMFANGGDIATASSGTETHTLKVNGHENTGGTALVNGDLSACGTGTPTVSAGSTDMAGTITEGTTATTCTLTFKATYTSAPFCTCTAETSGGAAILVGCNTTATTLVFVNASATGDKMTYMCIGQRGGT